MTPAPIGPPRETKEDIKFRGYNIPKGTLVLPNFWAVHVNPKVYPDPEKYNIDHFLKADGTLIRDSDNLVPFGTGEYPAKTVSYVIILIYGLQQDQS